MTLSDKRDDVFPDVPAAGELGYEDMEVYKGCIIAGVRKDTPDEIASWLTQQINAAIPTETYQKVLKSTNNTYTEPMSESEITTLLYAARDAYKEIIDKYLKK